MSIEEFLVLVIALALTVMFCCFVLNKAFWQGYRNSKFLDELYKEDFNNETKEISKSTKDM